jgi:hypothetical protein
MPISIVVTLVASKQIPLTPCINDQSTETGQASRQCTELAAIKLHKFRVISA